VQVVYFPVQFCFASISQVIGCHHRRPQLWPELFRAGHSYSLTEAEDII